MDIDKQNVLTNKAKRLRISILDMARRSKGPHVGSCLSAAEILIHLFFQELKYNPGNPDWEERDYFIMSKGHAAMALYASLAQAKIIDKYMLEGYMQDGGTLPAHLDRFSAKGIEVSAGALGHGLPIGNGLAHGLKLKGKKSRVFVLMGDGETQEGSVWEAAMLAPALGLNNLTAIIDLNNLQGYGRPSELMHFYQVAEKWQSFGWDVFEADGHNFSSLADAFKKRIASPKPAVIIAKTIKGKGISFMEDELKWHYFVVTDEIYKKALEELNRA